MRLMPWTDAPAAPAAEADVAARVDARTQLTILLTNLELAHRLLTRSRPEKGPGEDLRRVLLELTDDGIRSALTLREALRGRARSPVALPVGVRESG